MSSEAKRTGPTGSAGEGAFDLAHLEQATLGDRTLAREVLALFDRQAALLVAEIAAASDGRTRHEIAHRLKGAARAVGAFGVASAAEEAEAVADDADLLAAALAALSARVAEARLKLAELLAGDPF